MKRETRPTRGCCAIKTIKQHSLRPDFVFNVDCRLTSSGGLHLMWCILVHFIFMDPCIVVWLRRNNQQDAYLNQRLQIQLELLMMSGVPLETCWAFNERWNNKFYYKVASCWLFLLRHLGTFLVCHEEEYIYIYPDFPKREYAKITLNSKIEFFFWTNKNKSYEWQKFHVVLPL
jgi:hypothetical protein